MGRKVHDGQSERVLVPLADAVIKGNFYLYDGFFGMAMQDKAAATPADVEIVLNTEEAVYETSQITAADAFAKGDLVYFDAATKLLTTAAAAGANRLVGRVTVAKDADDVIWFKLGPQL